MHHSTKTIFAWSGGLALSGLLWGCTMGNTSGDLAAERFGDLRYALPASPETLSALSVADSCPPTAGLPGESSVVRRLPYLQQLTDKSVRILWTVDGPLENAQVMLRDSGGSVLGAVGATPDITAKPPEGATQWQADVTGLSADTRYCYTVEAGGAILRSASFRTAPAGDSAAPVKFVALGDSGAGGADQLAVLEQIRRYPFDFLIHMGDLAYNVGARTEIERNFFRVYGETLERFAMFPASGNHEYDTEEAAPFREAFSLFENGGPEGVERWYSYDWGDVHFVVLDTERVSPAQVAWLEADLTANQRPWVVAYLHKAPYSSGEHLSYMDVRASFTPLFEKYGVKLVLAGHDHNYERTAPQNGVTYIVTGGGGVGTRAVGRSEFTEFAESVCHFLYVVVEGGTMTVHAIDATGVEFDSARLSL